MYSLFIILSIDSGLSLVFIATTFLCLFLAKIKLILSPRPENIKNMTLSLKCKVGGSWIWIICMNI